MSDLTERLTKAVLARLAPVSCKRASDRRMRLGNNVE